MRNLRAGERPDWLDERGVRLETCLAQSGRDNLIKLGFWTHLAHVSRQLSPSECLPLALGSKPWLIKVDRASSARYLGDGIRVAAAEVRRLHA